MRMTVRGGSLWIAYTITRPREVVRLLPPHLELCGAPLLEDETALVPTPKLLFNAYEVVAPWMRGHRVEINVLGRDRRTGAVRFVVLDCLSDTLRWDPRDGVQGANARVVYSRTDPHAYRLEVVGTAPCAREARLAASGTYGAERAVDRRFAVDANRECYFGHVPTPIPMRFNETNVLRPVRALRGFSVANTMWRDVRSARPSHVFVHPHAMTFDVDVPRGFGRDAETPRTPRTP